MHCGTQPSSSLFSAVTAFLADQMLFSYRSAGLIANGLAILDSPMMRQLLSGTA